MLQGRSRQFVRLLLAVMVLAIGLPAQDRQFQVPLRNWSAPLYWHPSERESPLLRMAAGRARMATADQDVSSALTPSASPSASAPTYSAPLVFVAMTPCRLMDTRESMGQSGAFGPPSLGGNTVRTVPIPTHPTCGVPVAAAYSLNVTVVPPGPLGFLTIWPTGETIPNVSTLNAYNGQVVANAAIVPAGTNGYVNVFVSHPTDVILDINGYYVAAAATGGDASGNTALGDLALQNSTGTHNTALGNAALENNTTGSQNTATGGSALANNTTGADNTADGYQALFSNGGGFWNTAVGYQALFNNGNAIENTAVGYEALQANTLGGGNTATGSQALLANTTGSGNTATGGGALFSTTTGGGNTATGAGALMLNTTGGENTGGGDNALRNNTIGGRNTADGTEALWGNTTGFYNIGIGYRAAYLVSSGANYNIHIGTLGAPADSATIRIGANRALGDAFQQTQFFVSAVRGTATAKADAVPVVIDSAGQLGTISSSRTVKRDIEDMGDTTGTIMGLRPVSFRYKVHGPDSPRQYGLVAEEVAEVAPDLVARDRNGEIETVFYDKVNAMLLNQVQIQQRLIDSLKQQFADRLQSQEDLIRQLESRLTDIESRTSEK